MASEAIPKQPIHLSNRTLQQLRLAATLRGLEAEEYAEELLAISLAALLESRPLSSEKPYRAMQFSALTPTGCSAEEIDAEIEAGRRDCQT